VESSYRQGIEIDYSYVVRKWLSISGNATYMNAKIKEYTTDYDSITYVNVSPLLTPKVIFNQSVDFTYKKFEASVFMRYSGESYLDNTMNDSLIMPATTLFGASALVNISKSCSLSLVANNLFDALSYGGGYSAGGQRYYYVMAGRNFFATLNLKF
jgi:outer membrane receptor for ferrienterochelin and colicin